MCCNLIIVNFAQMLADIGPPPSVLFVELLVMFQFIFSIKSVLIYPLILISHKIFIFLRVKSGCIVTSVLLTKCNLTIFDTGASIYPGDKQENGILDDICSYIIFDT